MKNLTCSPESEDRYPCWSPYGKTIAFTAQVGNGFCVFAMDADGSTLHVVEVLRYHCAIDGSRAVWKPK